MSKLIIITGICGSGKTTLAKYLNKNIEESVKLSVDDVIENICDTVGYKNEQQKNKMRQIAKNTFKKILKECMIRKEKNIIIEYPFREEWQKIFKELTEKYQYEVITINVMVEDFDENWDRIIKRDFSSERHISHELNSYNPLYKDEYKRDEKIDYWKLKEKNDTKEFHKINLGRVIEFYNEDENSLKEVLQKIEE